MLLDTTRANMIKALKGSPSGAQRVLNEMYAGRKIAAIKELRALGRDVSPTFFGLRETKEFIEEYYTTTTGLYGGSDYSFNINTAKFMRDVSPKKGKRKKSLDFQFDGVDIRQINTPSLKTLLKSVKWELKRRGEKI